ncbi:uncharacterized protein TRIADDRAFT_61895 [Trichoplax adhaerens]|uniref:Deleted in malignant brain tumors 1 protein n=1 Tax=Trichoplax adhaerens TaxID=10228 RepID=B3SC98_TRIAD|nr:hypothetical protein TRIADDRAFT_61895 [Trichoplax adhaerens]EDV19642.1 hypothetical protein TRIADDRAFT_61895 [Trichoplax adhaerens]|eukprot:XP_002117880.1 hypothetical protein TRIADDRAFT_61895 [Trichoplax adhaerens]
MLFYMNRRIPGSQARLLSSNVDMLTHIRAIHFTSPVDCDCYILPLLIWKNSQLGRDITGKCHNLNSISKHPVYDLDEMSTFSHCSHRQTRSATLAESGSLRQSKMNVRIRGNTPEIGVVEIYYNQSWSGICSAGWSFIDAVVLCKQLGYEATLSELSNIEYKPDSSLTLMDIDCKGNESSLMQCRHSNWQSGKACSSGRLATARCVTPRVRLFGSNEPNEGIVQINLNGIWGTLCDPDFNMVAANVTCRQLNYVGAERVQFNFATGTQNMVSLIGNIRCMGDEEALYYCDHSPPSNSCTRNHTVGIICVNKTLTIKEGTIRLKNGNGPYEGRVEIYHNGLWGTICDQSFDLAVGKVICRQLGYSNVITVYGSARYRHGYGPVWLAHLKCPLNAKTLSECQHPGWGNSTCNHHQDASVMCQDKSICNNNQFPCSSGNKKCVPASVRCDFADDCADGSDERYCNAFPDRCDFQNDFCGWSQYAKDQFDWSRTKDGTSSEQTGPTYDHTFRNASGYFIFIEASSPREPGDVAELTSPHFFAPSDSECRMRFFYNMNGADVGSLNVRIRSGIKNVKNVTIWSKSGHQNGGKWTRAEIILRSSEPFKVVLAAVRGKTFKGDIAVDDISFSQQCQPLATAVACSKNVFKCKNRECIPYEDRCNFRRDCFDGSDEIDCTQGIYSYMCGFTNGLCLWSQLGDDDFDWTLNKGETTSLNTGPAGDHTPGDGVGNYLYIESSDPRLPFDKAKLISPKLLGPVELQDSCNFYFFYNMNGATIGSLEVWLVDSNNIGLQPINIWKKSGEQGSEWHLAAVRIHTRLQRYQIMIVGIRGNGYTGDIAIDDLWFSHQCRVVGYESDIVRLVTSDGQTSLHQGRVEIFHNGLWGTICDDGWGMPDANVICRQLGYPSAVALIKAKEFGPGNGTIWLSNVQCLGNETAIKNCHFSGWNVSNCSHMEDVGVKCTTATGPEASVRLVGGSSTMEGRVEVNYFGTWGTVCNENFGLREADVVCKQLGFTGGRKIYGSNKFGPGTGYVVVDSLTCNGTEASIFDCHLNALSNIKCYHSDDVGVSCTNKTVRIVGSSTVGRLEILHNNFWGTVCKTGWDLNDATVACRELGFLRAQNAITIDGFGPGDGPIWLSNLACYGNETTLLSCPGSKFGSVGNCNHTDDAGLRCTNQYVQFKTGDLRLVGGEGAWDGRLEIFYDGLWGTICSNNFNIYSANVVCRQIGFSLGASSYRNATHSNTGLGPVWLDNVVCNGDESDILMCNYHGWNKGNCLHLQDIAITCRSNKGVRINEQNPGVGMVEILHNGTWSGVCKQGWTNQDADVLCRELGYTAALPALNDIQYKVESSLTLQTVSCQGHELSIFDCSLGKWQPGDTCPTIELASVRCSSPKVKLSGSIHAYEGVIEINVNGAWGTVCNQGFNIAAANVTCRQLHYVGAKRIKTFTVPSSSNLPHLISRVQCTGDEGALAYCLHSRDVTFCSPEAVVGIECINKRMYLRDGDIQLKGGLGPSQGRVEIYYKGIWGTICDWYFDLTDGQAICRQLGYAQALTIYGSAHYGQGYGPVWLTSIDCPNDAVSLKQCQHPAWGLSSCSHHQDASVVCIDAFIDRCDFENGFCGWSQNFKDDFDWIIMHGKTPSANTGPDVDHTFHNKSGHYIYFEASLPHTTGQKADIASPHFFAPVDEECQIRLYYQMKGSGVGSFRVRTQFVDKRNETRFQVDGEQNIGRWTYVSVPLNSTVAFKVILEGVRGISLLGDIAVDDISFTQQCQTLSKNISCTDDAYRCKSGECIDVAGRCNFRIDCYDGSDEKDCDEGIYAYRCGFGRGICLWSQMYDDDFDWIRNSGETSSSGTGPLEGHTEKDLDGSSSYLYIEASSPRKPNDEARLISPELLGPVTFAEGCMFNFYYNMNGAFIGSLQIWLVDSRNNHSQSRLLWRRDGNQGSQWHFASVPVNTTFHYYQIIITGVRGISFLGDIAIDDLYFSHQCRVPRFNSNTVRLIDNSGQAFVSRGLLELLHDGVWGTLIRVLTGFPRALGYRLNGELGIGNGTIWLSMVGCLGNETSLEDCPNSGWNKTNCYHSEDVGVICAVVKPTSQNIRLVNGPDPSAGRLEVLYDGAWGTVCDDFFDTRDGDVACRQLGFTGVSRIYSSMQFGVGGGQIWLDNLACNGNELSIAQCPGIRWGITNCNHGEDVGISCTNDTARIIGSQSSGRFEIMHKGMWGTVCNKDWDLADADVACRQLGFVKALSAITDLQFGEGCTGNETSIVSCSHSGWGAPGTCQHSDDAAISCSQSIVGIEDGDIHLVGGFESWEGRIEIFHNGIWGTVCDDYFNLFAANVVCRQLNYPLGAESVQGNAYYGQGFGKIWLDDVTCSGSENRLTQCRYRNWGSNNCGHSEDVGVTCRTGTSQPTTNNNATLRIQETDNVDGEGYLRIYRKQLWLPLCVSNWNDDVSGVACHQLGYTTFIHVSQLMTTPPGNSYWNGKISCKGSEQSLAECRSWDWSKSSFCPQTDMVQVKCVAPRLKFFPENNDQGFLLVNHHGMWGTICDDNFGLTDANVACRQLGYTGAHNLDPFAQNSLTGSYPILLDDVSCLGNEPALAYCKHRNWSSTDCTHSEDVYVVCNAEKVYAKEWDIRLAGGSSKSGRLEVFHHGIWGTVCGKGFTKSAGDAACKQLGFASSTSVDKESFFGSGSGPIWLSNVICSTNAKSLIQCYHDTWGNSNGCTHKDDVGIRCKSDSDGDIRLVGGFTGDNLKYGLLELYTLIGWEVLCDDLWGYQEAMVVCKQLGIGNVGNNLPAVISPPSSLLAKGFNCYGHENSLSSCKTASVICRRTRGINIRCTNVRLYGSNFGNVGQLQVYYNGKWGTVCNKGFVQESAEVACKELGYTSLVKMNLHVSGFSSTNTVWLRNLQCKGSEKSIFNCSHRSWGDDGGCSSAMGVYLTCASVSGEAVEGGIKLVGSSKPSEGRVMIFHNGKWGSICGNGWDIKDAAIVCRQLGYKKAKQATAGSHFGFGSEPILLSNVQCDKSERYLLQCKRYPGSSQTCSHSYLAGVICDETSLISDGEVKLLGNGSEGFVRVFYNYGWHPVCGSLWTDTNARVFCKQLGFHSSTTKAINNKVSKFDVISIRAAHCVGKEERLIDCPFTWDTYRTCTSQAYTICHYNAQNLPSDGNNAPGIIAAVVVGVFITSFLIIVIRKYILTPQVRRSRRLPYQSNRNAASGMAVRYLAALPNYEEVSGNRLDYVNEDQPHQNRQITAESGNRREVNSTNNIDDQGEGTQSPSAASSPVGNERRSANGGGRRTRTRRRRRDDDQSQSLIINEGNGEEESELSL